MSLAYQKHCLTEPIGPSVMFGGLFTGLHVMQGMPFSPQLLAINCGGIFLYNALTCPMAAIHGRESALHNGMAGAILGYVVDPTFFYRNPRMSPPMVGAMIYGGIGTAFALLGNKRI
jgi:hypothetical protein